MSADGRIGYRYEEYEQVDRIHPLWLALKKYVTPNVLKRLGTFEEYTGTESYCPFEYIDWLFKVNPVEMKRYGTPEKLTKKVDTFQSFAGAHTFLGYDNCVLFNMAVKSYPTEQKTWFITKQDRLVVLQNILLKTFRVMEFDFRPLRYNILASYLKTHDVRLRKIFGFINVDDGFHDAISKEIKKFWIPYIDQSAEQSLSIKSVDDLLAEGRKILPNFEEYTDHYDILMAAFRNHSEALPPEQHSGRYKSVIWKMKVIIDCIESFMKSFPQYFEPIKKEREVQKVKYVREFRDFERRFVMTNEILRHPKRVMNGSVEFLETMEEEELDGYRKLEGKKLDIEFPIVMIERSKHCATPIRTPDEGHCKLAVDFFFEILQDMIFGLRIFQKLKEGEWPVIEEFFETKLDTLFDYKKEGIYFIRVEDFERERKTIMEYFQKYEDRPFNDNWAAPEDGFTVQNVKDKLVKLGFTELLPTVTKIAEFAHNQLKLKREEKVLSAKDFYDTVEKCVLSALILKLPNWIEFLHNQNGCERVLMLKCCQSDSQFDPYGDTRCKWIGLSEVEVCRIREDEELFGKFNQKMILPDGEELCYNDSAYETMVNSLVGHFPKEISEMISKNSLDYYVFLMNKKEVDWLTDEFMEECPVDVRVAQGFSVSATLAELGVFFPKKKLYIRTFQTKGSEDKKDAIVFIDEVLPMIVLALKRQGDKLTTEQINNILDTWVIDSGREKNDNDFNLRDLDYLLQSFCVDKTQFTLVPDISYAFYHKNNKIPRVIGPNREELMENSAALFQIFRDVVCDVDWMDGYTTNDNPQELLHDEIMKVMRLINGRNRYVRTDLVERCVEKLKNHPHYLMRKKDKKVTPLIDLMDSDDNSLIRVVEVYSDIERLSFPLGLPSRRKIGERERIVVWKFRLLCYYAYLCNFFDYKHNPDSEKLRSIIRSMIRPRDGEDFCKEPMAIDMTTIKQMKRQPGETNGPFVPHEPKKHHWFQDTDSTSEDESIGHPSPKKPYVYGRKKVIKGHVPKIAEVDEPPSIEQDLAPKKKKKKNKKTQPESPSPVMEEEVSECCKAAMGAQRTEMDEVKLMVKTLQEEVQRMKLQNQEAPRPDLASAALTKELKKLDEKFKRTSKLCNERSAELETTTRKLKKCEESESAAQKKLKVLEEKQKEKPTREELMKELEKLKKEKNAEVETLKRKVEEMEQEKMDQAQLHEAVEIRNSELTADVQRLQLAAETATEEFAVRLSELETYNSDKERFIRLLKGKLSPETLAEINVRLPLEMSRLFHELLPQDGQLIVEQQEANRKVNKLTLLTPGNIELHRRADWWRIEFQEACTRYSTALVENIRRIRADHFITKAELVPQPDYPVLAEFITTELEQAQERARDARNAQIDAECPICLEPEEGEWWWCPGCLKKFHQDCIDAAWADGEQRCPSCRRLFT